MTFNNEHRSLPTENSQVPVPTFGCIVYVSTLEDGTTFARVANLGGLSVTGSNERESLRRLVPMFKNHVKGQLESGEAIAWIDPVPSPSIGEQRRFLPVHL